MELQWPLILFTTLVAWCSGLFASQCILALQGQAKKSQMTAWIVSAILLVAGGVSVFLHLQHWERIFNGFGHLTSGITQELIMIVVLAVVAIIYLVYLRKSDDGGTVPKWVAIAGIVASVGLVLVMAHSYMMAARPAWNSILEVLSLVGAACVMGPATMAAIVALRKDEAESVGLHTVIGTLVNAVTSVAYLVYMQISGSSFASVGYSFDPTHPGIEPLHMMEKTGVFSGEYAMLTWLGVIVIGVLVPVVLSLLANKKKDGRTWAYCGIIIAVAGCIGAVCLRILFYHLGISVLPLY